MTDTSDDAETSTKEEISKELSRIEEASKWSSQSQFERSKTWRGIHLVLTVPAAILAAVTGGTLLADAISVTLAGALTLIAAAVAGAGTALDPAGKSVRSQTAGNRYLALQSAARRARNIDLPTQSFEQGRSRLTELTETQDEINADSPVISDRAYERARKNIEETGGQDYKVDADG